MKPVRTATSNIVYVGPPGIGDLHAERVGTEPGRIRSVWHLSKAEREYIAAGGNIELEILTEPIPPVALNVTDAVGVGEDAPDVLERLQQLADLPSDRPPKPPPPPRDREVG
jgi:hypothetical protein